MDIISSNALNSFVPVSLRDAIYIRSATKLIIAQAKEEQTLVRTQRIQKNVD